MQTLQLSEDKAKKLYHSAPPEWKQVLEESFPKGFFSQNIMERVKTFEDACAITGDDPDDENFSTGTLDEIAFKKLKVVRNALLEGNKIDPKDPNQKKWYPWHQNSASGFRFDVSHFVHTYSCTPARLCLDTEAKSNYFGKQFIDLFEQYKN
jgi:hypothetical protein